MKLFLKILGGILYGFLVLFLWSIYLACIVASVYGIVWTWTAFNNELGAKIGMTVLCVIGFFTTLFFIYMTLDEHVNPTPRYPPLPPKCIRPIPPEPEKKKSKPILG